MTCQCIGFTSHCCFWYRCFLICTLERSSWQLKCQLLFHKCGRSLYSYKILSSTWPGCSCCRHLRNESWKQNRVNMAHCWLQYTSHFCNFCFACLVKNCVSSQAKQPTWPLALMGLNFHESRPKPGYRTDGFKAGVWLP